MLSAMELCRDRIPWLFLTIILIAGALHRGGISIQAHLFWIIGLFPLFFISQKIFKNKLFPKRTILLLTALSILLIFSWTVSEVKNFGFFSITGLLAGIGTFIITSQWNLEKEKFQTWIEYILLFGTFLTVFGFIIYTKATPDRLFATFAEYPGFFTSYPNAFALFLMTLLPFSIYFLIEKKTLAWKIITTILFSGIILTFSRGTWIATIGTAGIAILLFRKALATHHIKLLGGILVGVTILTFGVQLVRQKNFSTNTLTEKIGLKSDEKKTSVNERMEFWKKSFPIIAEKPLLGHGPDSFAFAYTKHQEKMLAISGHPHNLFLKIATENGLPAMVIFMAFLFLIFKNLLKSRHPYSKIFLLTLTAILFHNTLDYNLNFTSTNLLFWTFLGWSANISEEKIKAGKNTFIITTIIFALVFLTGIYEILERREIVQGRVFIGNEKLEEGLKKIEGAQPIFRQELDILQAETYKMLAERDEFGQWGTQGILHLENSMKKNPSHSGLKNLAAELYFLEGNEISKKNAQKLINETLQIDNKNWLRHYYNWITINGVVANQKEIKKILRKYYGLLKVNAHNTIVTDNPHYAVRLAYLINEKELAKKITNAALRERAKFAENFDIPLPKF